MFVEEAAKTLPWVITLGSVHFPLCKLHKKSSLHTTAGGMYKYEVVAGFQNATRFGRWGGYKVSPLLMGISSKCISLKEVTAIWHFFLIYMQFCFHSPCLSITHSIIVCLEVNTICMQECVFTQRKGGGDGGQRRLGSQRGL